MRISIVTISYNQAAFLRACINSVLSQNIPGLQYIVVDAGSTDGSREIIESYSDRLSYVFEPDDGPADGLNKGFSQASGEIFGFLNSDDVYLPGACAEAMDYFSANSSVDVVSAHCNVIDSHGLVLRKAYSERMSLIDYAYGASTIIQPSTFFRRSAYLNAGGFNANNRSNWDGELLVDMALHGSNFEVVDRIWSAYRLHSLSVTSSKKLHEEIKSYERRVFSKIMKREFASFDPLLALCYRIKKHVTNPKGAYERIAHGPIYGRQG